VGHRVMKSTEYNQMGKDSNVIKIVTKFFLMMYKNLMLNVFLFIVPFALLAQCDTSFYYFKRAIIEKLSDNLNLDSSIKIPKKTIRLEFSDYQRFFYVISDSKSTLGFVCLRDKACNTYSDSFCILNKNKNTYNVEKTLFENFMSSDDSKICDSINYLHTLAKVIESPIDGWQKLEDYYFRFLNSSDLDTYYKGRTVHLIMPVYVLLDKKLKRTYFYTIKISGTQKKDILIERRQIVINK